MAKAPKSADSNDDDLITEARDRFQYALEYYGTARARQLEDQKFYFGDSDNGYQWPSDVRRNRELDAVPTLTINMVRQFVLNVVNDGRQHKSDIKIDPVSDKATYEGAQVMTGIIKYIEALSRATDAYDVGILHQVQMGVGYWRVMTRYTNEWSLDQDLVIEPIPDPFSVLIDPDARQKSKRDMAFAFIYEDVPKKTFEQRYPEFKNISDHTGITLSTDWKDDKHVRVAEYYRRKPLRYTLVAVVDEQTHQIKTYRSDEQPKKIWEKLIELPDARTRVVETYEVEWYKIVGNTIVDRRTHATGDLWVGTTIPLVAIMGEESVVEGQYDCRGHVRFLKDPGRMYNYWSSAAVEQVALQTKTPWIAPARAIEGYTEIWGTANTVNHSILPYNDLSDEGQTIQAPQRIQPPVMAQSYLQGMQAAQLELRAASGQWQEDMGQQSNAASGIAINARVRQSNLSTQHFIENQAVALSYTGEILVEMIPKIYDTRRVIRILGETGTEREVTLDPDAEKEYQEERMQREDRARIIFNPGFGRYSVVVEAGPSYATRRQEAFNALAQILQASPQLVPLVGDILFQSADFPLADQLAERLRRAVPPYVLGEGPTPQEQQMLQQMQAMRQALANLMQQAAERKIDDGNGLDKHAIEEFRAETERLKVLLSGFAPEQIGVLVRQALSDTLGTQLPNVPAGTGNANLRPPHTLPEGVGSSATANALAQAPQPQAAPAMPAGMPPGMQPS